MSKGDIAKENFLSGLNCAQSVVLAFKGELGVAEQTLKDISRGFGGGLARLRLTCGAVSGMAMVLSVLHKDKDKAELYAIIQTACDKFKAELGSLICGELLEGKAQVGGAPEERCNEYYKKRPCAEICKIAADIIERLEENI